MNPGQPGNIMNPIYLIRKCTETDCFPEDHFITLWELEKYYLLDEPDISDINRLAMVICD